MSGALLDTSAVLDLPEEIFENPEGFAVSVVTIGELRTGTVRAPDERERAFREESLKGVYELFVPIDIDVAVAERFGDTLAHAQAEGRTQKTIDLLIIATAATTGRTLITRDRKQAALARSFGVEVQLAA